MAYYTGQANSFADLLNALKNACVAEGWTLTDSGATWIVLNKSTAYVKIEDVILDTSTPESLLIQGGTGYSAGALVEPSFITPRLGRGHNRSGGAAYTWPMDYHVFIHTNPDEVYFIVNYAVEYYHYLAFGIADTPGLPGTGNWISANSMRYQTEGYGGDYSQYHIGNDYGGSDQGSYSHYKNGGFFWRTKGRYSNSTSMANQARYQHDSIHTGLNNLGTNGWAGTPAATGEYAPGIINAIRPLKPLMEREPSSWNNEATLLGIKVFEYMADAKVALAAELRHSRYVRIDYYNGGDLITLGTEKWMVFPFYKKNILERNGGSGIDHTGTFGFAIRYDGP